MGDIAANLVMAERLAAAASDRYRFSLSIRHSVLVKVRRLWPGSLPGRRSGPPALRVFSETRPTSADAVLTFSYMEHDPLDTQKLDLLGAAPQRLVYQEPGASGLDEDPGQQRLVMTTPTPAVSMVCEPERVTVTRRTGAGVGGFYMRPSVLPDRHATIAALCAASEQPVPPSARLAFCYCRDPGLARGYAVAVASLAGKRPLLLVTNHPINLPGVTVLPAALPLALSTALIQCSDEMPLLTGDVSLSLRLEVARPFFYELNVWKTYSMTRLLEQLCAASPQDVTRLRAALTLPLGQPAQPERFSAALDDSDFQERFRQGLHVIQGDSSLVDTVLADLAALRSMAPRQCSLVAFSVLSRLWRKHRDLASVEAAARAQVFSDAPLALRSDTLLALLALPDWQRCRQTLQVFRRVFAGEDPLLLSVWQVILGENLTIPAFQLLCSHLGREDGLKAALLAIVSPDPEQYTYQEQSHRIARQMLERW